MGRYDEILPLPLPSRVPSRVAGAYEFRSGLRCLADADQANVVASGFRRRAAGAGLRSGFTAT